MREGPVAHRAPDQAPVFPRQIYPFHIGWAQIRYALEAPVPQEGNHFASLDAEEEWLPTPPDESDRLCGPVERGVAFEDGVKDVVENDRASRAGVAADVGERLVNRRGSEVHSHTFTDEQGTAPRIIAGPCQRGLQRVDRQIDSYITHVDGRMPEKSRDLL